MSPPSSAQDPGLTLRAGAATDVGRVRRHNEDSVLARVFVVADGMGGHAAGEVASRIVTETLGELAERPRLRPEDVVSSLALPTPDPAVGGSPPRADRHGHHSNRPGRRLRGRVRPLGRLQRRRLPRLPPDRRG